MVTVVEKELVKGALPFTNPCPYTSIRQIVETGALLVLLYSLGFWLHQYSTIAGVLLGTLAGVVLVRVFIIQHDCGHGSFFQSKTANDVTGVLCSIATLIPYYYWRRQHAIHHATNGDLSGRGHGDIDVCTVREFLALSPAGRLRYRLHRNPAVFLLFGPLYLTGYANRFAFDKRTTTRREQLNVWLTNFNVALAYGLLAYYLGVAMLCSVVLPSVYIAGAVGIWLFYIQHQFEHTYWSEPTEWSYVDAALKGSSYYKLPAILNWLTGSIGYHHIHHLLPKIPNYRLQDCHESNPRFSEVFTLTLKESIRSASLNLWDEQERRLISFKEMRDRYGNLL